MFDNLTWENMHQFPTLRNGLFDGKISNTFLFLYDEAVKNITPSIYGTLENVTVKIQLV